MHVSMIATRIRSSFSRRNLEFAGKIGFGAEVWILLRENRVAPTLIGFFTSRHWNQHARSYSWPPESCYHEPRPLA